MLRIFLTLPVTVAQAERSFSALARVKNVLRSTMCQSRLSSLGTLAMEPVLCRNIDFDDISTIYKVLLVGGCVCVCVCVCVSRIGS